MISSHFCHKACGDDDDDDGGGRLVAVVELAFRLLSPRPVAVFGFEDDFLEVYFLFLKKE